MNRQETIESIKASLKKLFSIEQKFAEYTTTDGMKIHCSDDKIEVGSEVFGVDDLGNFIALNNGTYELSEGFTINVVDGKVESISEVATTEEDELESVGETITPSEPKEEEMGKKVKMLEEQMTQLLEIIKDMTKGQDKMSNVLMKEIEDLKKQPASNSIKTDKKGFSGFEGNFSKQVRMSEIDEIRKLISDKNRSNNNLAL